MQLDDIKKLLGDLIFYRARQYVEEGHIESVDYPFDNTVSALVNGSNSKQYTVHLNFAEHKFTCSCPFPQLCKHIGAVFIYLYNQNHPIILNYSPSENTNFDKALEQIKTSITKAEDIIIPLHSDLSTSRFPNLDAAVSTSTGALAKKASKRYRLVFVIEDRSIPQSCTIIPAVQYIKLDGTFGRIENYAPEKITEEVSPASEKLRKNLLADRVSYFNYQQRDSLTAYLPFIVEDESIPLFYRNSYDVYPVTKEKINRLHVSFKITSILGKMPQFTPLFKINDYEPIMRKNVVLNATGNNAYLITSQGKLFYSLENANLAYLIKHFEHTLGDFNLNDIKYITRICNELNDDSISVEFTKKEVRITHIVPTPIIIFQGTLPPIHFIVRFSYNGNECSKNQLEGYLMLSSNNSEEYLIAKRNFAFEDIFFKKLQAIVAKAPGIKLANTDVLKHPLTDTVFRANMSLFDFLAQFGSVLLKDGVIFKVENEKESLTISSGKIMLHISSGIDWFSIDPKYREDGIDYDIIFNFELLQKGFIQVGSTYRILTPKEIELLMLLAEHKHSKDDRFTSKISKKDFAEINRMIELLPKDQIKGDISEAARTQEIYKKLINLTNIPHYPLPEDFKGILRPYQVVGYRWLRFIHENELGGMLADDMGLGKTIQTLVLLQSLKSAGMLQTSLIVLPVSTIANWINEIQRFTPNLSVYAHRGGNRVKTGENFYKYDLILTSYQTLQRDIKMFSECNFYYVILDEAQYIKNAHSKTYSCVMKLNAKYRLSLSGTPLENNTLELWAQMNFLNNGILGNKEFFKKNYSYPIEKYHDQKITETLRKKVSPFILRRKKEDVADDLPPKEIITVYLDMTDKQRELYETWRKVFSNEVEKKLKELNAELPPHTQMFILTAMLRLRQICIFPELFDKEYAHYGSAKFDYLKDIVDEIVYENHKVICFSQFVKALTIIRKHFDERKIPYCYLDGKTVNRQELIENFQYNAKVPLFLISLKAGGLGINLTSADYVIIFDPWWNPAVENQAIDRAHRIGRKNKVIAYRLIMKNSIEEKMELLQNKKRQLFSDLITEGTAFLNKLSKEEIMELFS